MPPTKHSEHGASKAKRWMSCPGSVRKTRGMFNPSSPYAREGTAAHDIGERCLEKGVDALTFLGVVVPVAYWDEAGIEHADNVVVTEEMCEAVQVYVDYVMSMVDAPTDELMLEIEFDLNPLNPPVPMFGTSDATLWKQSTKHLHVIDYKHGAGVAVDATENEQLMYYALGALVEVKKAPDTITIHIVQPRGFHPLGPIRTFTFTLKELKEFKDQLFDAARATLEPDAPLNIGDHCRFCPALAVCPAQQANALAVAQQEFTVMDEALPDPDELSTEHLALVLAKGDIVVDWIKAVRKHVISKLDRGEEVPGFKLVPGRGGNRRWIDEEKVSKYLAGKKLKVDERFHRKLISPAQAEKLLKTRGAKLPGELWSKPEPGLKLVPDADSRQALLPSTQTDFDIPNAKEKKT